MKAKVENVIVKKELKDVEKFIVEIEIDKEFKSFRIERTEHSITNGESSCVLCRIIGFYTQFNVEEIVTNKLTVSLPYCTCNALKTGDEIEFEQTLIHEGEMYNGDTIAEHPFVITNLTLSAETKARKEKIENEMFAKLFGL